HCRAALFPLLDGFRLLPTDKRQARHSQPLARFPAAAFFPAATLPGFPFLRLSPARLICLVRPPPHPARKTGRMFPRLTDEEIARLYPADLSLSAKRLFDCVVAHNWLDRVDFYPDSFKSFTGMVSRPRLRLRLPRAARLSVAECPPNWRMCYAASGLHSVVLQLLHEPRSGIEEPHTGAHPAHEGAPPKFLSGGSRAQYRRILETFPEKKNGTKNQLVTVIEQGGWWGHKRSGELADLQQGACLPVVERRQIVRFISRAIEGNGSEW
ncbi:MAG: hypothetical protein BJ554DRAFT_3304, partial [Olpidium bornovanus]